MILVIDNYDSFVENLARYIRLLGFETMITRNDQITPQAVRQLGPEAIVISPGPKSPGEAGESLAITHEFLDSIPILGICLGHQIIVEACGGNVRPTNCPMHGQASWMQHNHAGLFEGLENPLSVGRYHSLIAESKTLPKCLQIDGWLEDGTIMAVSHRDYPVVGWQFHPESLLTEVGRELMFRFFVRAGLTPTRPALKIKIFSDSCSVSVHVPPSISRTNDDH